MFAKRQIKCTHVQHKTEFAREHTHVHVNLTNIQYIAKSIQQNYKAKIFLNII